LSRICSTAPGAASTGPAPQHCPVALPPPPPRRTGPTPRRRRLRCRAPPPKGPTSTPSPSRTTTQRLDAGRRGRRPLVLLVLPDHLMGWRFVGQRIQRVTDPLPSVTPGGRWGRWEAER
jgi:hypothetical protein